MHKFLCIDVVADLVLKYVRQPKVAKQNNETTMHPKYDGNNNGMFSIIIGRHLNNKKKTILFFYNIFEFKT